MSENCKHIGYLHEKYSCVVCMKERINELEEVLKEIFKVLDNELGDSDPIDDFTEEEIKDEYPLLWCAMQISKTQGVRT